jgi:hypothetical protein
VALSRNDPVALLDSSAKRKDSENCCELLFLGWFCLDVRIGLAKDS